MLKGIFRSAVALLCGALLTNDDLHLGDALFSRSHNPYQNTCVTANSLRVSIRATKTRCRSWYTLKTRCPLYLYTENFRNPVVES